MAGTHYLIHIQDTHLSLCMLLAIHLARKPRNSWKECQGGVNSEDVLNFHFQKYAQSHQRCDLWKKNRCQEI